MNLSALNDSEPQTGLSMDRIAKEMPPEEKFLFAFQIMSSLLSFVIPRISLDFLRIRKIHWFFFCNLIVEDRHLFCGSALNHWRFYLR